MFIMLLSLSSSLPSQLTFGFAALVELDQVNSWASLDGVDQIFEVLWVIIGKTIFLGVLAQIRREFFNSEVLWLDFIGFCVVVLKYYTFGLIWT